MGSIGKEQEPERILKTDLREYSNRTRQDGPYADNLDLDVLIVGAGKLLVHNVSCLASKTMLVATPLRGQYGVWTDTVRTSIRSFTNSSKASAALSVCTKCERLD